MTGNFNTTGVRTFTAGEALAKNRRVKLSSGKMVYSDAGENWDGTTLDAAASDALVSVRLKNSPGTHLFTAAGAFAAGAALYGANDGKVDDSASGAIIATALEAASGDNSIVEGMLLFHEGTDVDTDAS